MEPLRGKDFFDGITGSTGFVKPRALPWAVLWNPFGVGFFGRDNRINRIRDILFILLSCQKTILC
jgi:hypothetical protein